MAWDVVYYRSRDGSIQGVEFLDNCPTKVTANLLAVLDAVAESPPPQYSGGGKWEVMHGSMAGYYEVRATGPGREQLRPRERRFRRAESSRVRSSRDRRAHRNAQAVEEDVRRT